MVRGGIYEVDLNEWKCNSVYWPGPGLEIMRGTWFHDTSWQPVDCEHADRIEAEHIKRFMGHKMADYIWDPTNQCRREVMVSLEKGLLTSRPFNSGSTFDSAGGCKQNKGRSSLGI